MVITWMQLQRARENAGLTQTGLADALKVSRRTVTNWEANGVPRKAEYKVRDALGKFLDAPEGDQPNVDIPPARRSAPSLSHVTDEELLLELLTRTRSRETALRDFHAPNSTPAGEDFSPITEAGQKNIRAFIEELRESIANERVSGVVDDVESQYQRDQALAAKKRSKNRGEINYD